MDNNNIAERSFPARRVDPVDGADIPCTHMKFTHVGGKVAIVPCSCRLARNHGNGLSAA